LFDSFDKRFDLMGSLEDGTTTKDGVFFQGFGPVGPDGLAMDQEGNLLICAPGLGRVFVVDRCGISH
jgi:sugar lactone lactonase YvrE